MILISGSEIVNKAFSENSCEVVLTEDNGKCIGTGIVFYYDSVPSTLNVTEKNAYITSMYVEPDYRRKGIGTTILEKIVAEAAAREYKIIMLNASEMAKPMYKKWHFSRHFKYHYKIMLDVKRKTV